MSDFEPNYASKHPAGRFYGGVSRTIQNEIDGFDDTDPEQVLNRQDSERDYAHRQNHDDDVTTVCNEVDERDYDRFPQQYPRRRAE
jgi:hypothetical protein